MNKLWAWWIVFKSREYCMKHLVKFEFIRHHDYFFKKQCPRCKFEYKENQIQKNIRKAYAKQFKDHDIQKALEVLKRP